MDTDALIETLGEAGLSPYQAAAYVTILETGSLPAQELASQSGVPGPRIYDVLGSLEEKGYIVTTDREQLYAQAIDPAEGVAGLRSRIGRLQEAITEIEDRWERPTAEEIDIGVVKQFQTVLRRARDAIETAETQVLLALSSRQFFELESTIRAAHQRGISIQVALHYTAGNHPRTEDLVGSCTEVRIGRVAAMYEQFLVIADGRAVCFAPFVRERSQDGELSASDEIPPKYGLLVTDPVHAYVFEWYFLAALWEPAERLYSEKGDEPPLVFIDIREVIKAVDPLLRDGSVVEATVDGRSVATGKNRTVSGRITGVRSDTAASPEGERMESLLTREATLVIENDDGRTTVGGKGAYHEDIEAVRVTVTAIHPPDDVA